jgi:hypothetical protein
MAPRAQLDVQLHRPSYLLRLQCGSLKNKLLDSTKHSNAWLRDEAAILSEAASDLIDVVSALERQALAASQPSLAFQPPPQPPVVLDAANETSPEHALDALDALDAHERITALAPSLVLYPHILSTEIRELLKNDNQLSAERALVLLNLEQRLAQRTIAAP